MSIRRRVTRRWGWWDHEGVRAVDVAESYSRLSADLIRFSATVVGPSDAEDVVAAAMVSVLTTGVSEVVDPQRYLYRAVLNAGRKHIRANNRRARRERFVAPRDSVDAIEPDVDMRHALALLSPQQAAVVHLAYWEDLSASAIADRLGVTDGTVRRQLARGRRRLSEVLDEPT